MFFPVKLSPKTGVKIKSFGTALFQTAIFSHPAACTVYFGKQY